MAAPAVQWQSPVFLIGGELTEEGRQTIAKLQGYFVAEGNDYETALDFAWQEIESDSNLAREAYRELVDPEPPPDLSKAAKRWLARTNRLFAGLNAKAAQRARGSRVLAVIVRPRGAGSPSSHRPRS